MAVWPFFNLGFWERRRSYIIWKGSESQGGVGRVWSSSQDLQEFLVTPGWPEDSASSIRASLVSASTHSTRHSPPLGGGPSPLGPPPTRAFQASSWPPQCILCMDTHLPVFFTFMIRAVLVSRVSPCVSFRCLRCFFSFNPKYSTSYHTLCSVMWGPERWEMSRAHSRDVETDQRGGHSRGRRREVTEGQATCLEWCGARHAHSRRGSSWRAARKPPEAPLASPALSGAHRGVSMGTVCDVFTPGATPLWGEPPGGTKPTEGSARGGGSWLRRQRQGEEKGAI